MQETESIDEYILQHIDPESDYLKSLYRDTHVKLLRPRMASGHLQGPFADKIRFYIGDALELVPRLGVTFDMAFIDGDKRKYIEYYEMTLAHLSEGGYIIADNTLWDGHVLEQPRNTDAQTIGIKAFNDLIAQDVRVEKVILPLRDGLTIIRKKIVSSKS